MRRFLATATAVAALTMSITPAIAIGKSLRQTCGGWKTDAGAAIEACGEILGGRAGHRDRIKAHYYRGKAYIKKKEYRRAIADLTRAIQLNPNYGQAYNGRGHSYRLIGEYGKSIADFTRALEFAPASAAPSLLTNRGVALRYSGDLAAALADYDRALELNPSFARAYYNRSYVFFKQGRFGRARADLFRAERLGYRISRIIAARARIDRAEAARRAPGENAPRFIRVALVIGNASYKHTPKLANPTHDAADMAIALRRLGFKVIEESNLTKGGMEEALRRFERELKDADAALFYYAGHAMQFEGANYLMPVDAKLRSKASLTNEMASVDDVVASMNIAGGLGIVMLDACRDNPLEQSFKRALAPTRSVTGTRGLARMIGSEGLIVAYATQAGNVAADGGGRNSPFAAALLEHIETPGLEVGPLLRRVMGTVKRSTAGRQHPELSVLFDGEFYFSAGS